jgi:hypothetical protein
MFVGVSHSGGVAERSNAAVLKLIVGIALGCKDRHLFRNSGTWMHGVEPAGTGVGIKIGIRPQPVRALTVRAPTRLGG